MDEIGKILPSVFKAQVRRADPPLVEILTPLWPRVVGKAMAQHTRPAAFWAGTLTLATSCGSWAAQLRQLADEIRAQINTFLGGPIVKKLRVEYVLKAEPDRPPKPIDALPGSEPLVPSRANSMAVEDSEISAIVERSYAKYFARARKRVN